MKSVRLLAGSLALCMTVLSCPVSASAGSEAAAASAALPSVVAVEDLDETNSQTVYVAGKGKKYHKKSTCSNMKNAKKMSLEDAKAKGYTACKKCYK